jgi:hypothetical protein
LVAAQL